MDMSKVNDITKKISQAVEGYTLETLEVKVSENEIYVLVKAKK